MFDGQAGSVDYIAHCVGVYGILARDYNNACAISHDYVFALTCDPESRFFKSPNGPQMVDNRQLGHR